MTTTPRRSRVSLAVILFLPVVLLACVHSTDDGSVSLRVAGGRLTKPVKSFQELREAKLVRQGWDISCGAAALSTILTYQYGEDYPEAVIAVSILQNVDPKLVRARGGFSLLDLKRFSEAVGYQATGYGDLTVDDLMDFGVPAILPVRIRNYDHFIVFRGRAGNRVLIGDPAFGNLTVPLDEFHQMWPSKIGFLVRPSDISTPDKNPLAPNTMNMMVPNLNHLYRTLRAGGPVPATRRPRFGFR